MTQLTSEQAIEALYEYIENKVGQQADTNMQTVCKRLDGKGSAINLFTAYSKLSDEIVCLIDYAAAIAVVRDALKAEEKARS